MIKYCPFCGKQGEVRSWLDLIKHETTYIVRCNNFECKIQPATYDCKTRAAAISDGWQCAFKNLTPEKEAEYRAEREAHAKACQQCADEHKQLVTWLKKLQKIERIVNAPEYMPQEVQIRYYAICEVLKNE